MLFIKGEKHSWESDTVEDLQHAVRSVLIPTKNMQTL